MDKNKNNIAMELQCQLLLYLDRRRYLDDMKNECEIFLYEQSQNNRNKFPPLRYLLQINVMDLLDAFADLGMVLIREPLKWQRMCSMILFACLKSLTGELKQEFKENQCLALIRLKSLSKLLVHPNPHNYDGIVLFEGILISISKPTSYIYHTLWFCPEACEGSEVVLHYFPKAPPKCFLCRSILLENSGLRGCGEQVTATFVLNELCQSKNLVITDDLIPKLTIGLKYSIHAIVVKTLRCVWSLEQVEPLATPLTCPVLEDIQKLYHGCDSLPWKFIYCLASNIGISVCPSNCFMHLKISLLISLCSVKASLLTDSDIVHVLAAGFDTGYAGLLMTDAARIADRSIFLGTYNTSVTTSLLASSGGVCVMPLPLCVYNQKQTCAILAAVESGELSTDTAKAKLRSAVWTQGQRLGNVTQGMHFKKIDLNNVGSVFGTVCRVDFDEYEDEIIKFHLERCVDTQESSGEEKRYLKELATYIDLVAGIEVSMEVSTKNLLRNYFLAARKEGPPAVSVAGMRGLMAACVTSARLCRRSVANIDDAVLAIWLHVSGGPEPRFAPNECLQTTLSDKNLHKMMDSFKIWLGQFTKR